MKSKNRTNVKDLSKSLLPTAPGTDLADPRVMSGAKRVATRKNNDFRRMVAKKIPLFAAEAMASYTPVTPEKVIERRIGFQASTRELTRRINQLHRAALVEKRAAVRRLVEDDAEFLFLMRRVARMQGGDYASKWGRTLSSIKQRLTEPPSEAADLVLAWLETEEQPVTHLELHRRRGDGLEPLEILKALIELMSLALVATVDLVEVEETGGQPGGTTAWTWECCRVGDNDSSLHLKFYQLLRTRNTFEKRRLERRDEH